MSLSCRPPTLIHILDIGICTLTSEYGKSTPAGSPPSERDQPVGREVNKFVRLPCLRLHQPSHLSGRANFRGFLWLCAREKSEALASNRLGAPCTTIFPSVKSTSYGPPLFSSKAPGAGLGLTLLFSCLFLVFRSSRSGVWGWSIAAVHTSSLLYRTNRLDSFIIFNEKEPRQEQASIQRAKPVMHYIPTE
ncbi:hypothetical protein AAMO2058_001108100 [Amorphochlora amoebiformis]